ncbi:hypothetical protein [Photobacterium leiognathi]|uniref:hypothetical protein n=1 Tax=Photobacterium leiognathi TaxID=553611 RepID=UPI0029817946|nr:hypothetical protein [Photobacterium leiognathi]
MNFIIRLAFILTASLSSACFAENLPKENMEKKPTVVTNNKSSEIQLYKELYEISLKSNESMVTSVQWSVGVITTFVIALFGGQAFYSFRVSKKEFQKIQSHFDERLAFEINKIDRDLSKIKEDLTGKITEVSAQINRDMPKSIDEKIKNETEQLVKSTDSKIEQLSINMASHFKAMGYKISTVESYLWEVKDVKANTLRAYTEIYAYETTTPGSNRRTLQNISDLLESMKSIDKSVKEKLLSLLKASKEDAELVKVVIEKINGLAMYEFVNDSQGNLHAVELI